MKFFITALLSCITFSSLSSTLATIDHSPAPVISHTKSITYLTPQERLWLDANPILPIASDHTWYPFIFIDNEGKLAGFNVELIALINKNLGTHFTIKRHTSWSAAYEKLVKGKISALMSVISEHNLLNLIIEDNGAGISEQNISKIFEPFYTTNRDNGGSGLGLNIVYNIVTTQLSGRIGCHSKLGQGTTFSITFPVTIHDD